MEEQEQREITALARNLQQLAEEKNFEELAGILPNPSQFAAFMQAQFADPQTLQRFDEEVLNRE